MVSLKRSAAKPEMILSGQMFRRAGAAAQELRGALWLFVSKRGNPKPVTEQTEHNNFPPYCRFCHLLLCSSVVKGDGKDNKDEIHDGKIQS